jgi:hypothetical protein
LVHFDIGHWPNLDGLVGTDIQVVVLLNRVDRGEVDAPVEAAMHVLG